MKCFRNLQRPVRRSKQRLRWTEDLICGTQTRSKSRPSSVILNTRAFFHQSENQPWLQGFSGGLTNHGKSPRSEPPDPWSHARKFISDPAEIRTRDFYDVKRRSLGSRTNNADYCIQRPKMFKALTRTFISFRTGRSTSSTRVVHRQCSLQLAIAQTRLLLKEVWSCLLLRMGSRFHYLC